MSLERSFLGSPCIVVHAAVHSYQPCKKAVRIYAVFQLDKLTVIFADKTSWSYYFWSNTQLHRRVRQSRTVAK